jgi:hypothetical protein
VSIKESKQKMHKIEVQMDKEKSMAKTDAENYKKMKESESYKSLLTQGNLYSFM